MSQLSMGRVLGFWGVFAAITTLQACGGGGGEPVVAPDGPVASTLTFQTGAAARKFLGTTASYSYSEASPDGPFTNNVSLSIKPLASVSLPALSTQPVQVSSHDELWTTSLSVRPTLIHRNVFYYTPSPVTFRGTATYEGDLPDPVGASTPLPETATVGQSGALFANVKWSLEPDTAQTAWFCQNLSSTTACLKINPEGTLLGFKAAQHR
ncbi:MAG: hypothetical protein Q8R63_07730 [Ramlibacter sp.]|nr:hypothetical protein [Ramlibacter sp.]